MQQPVYLTCAPMRIFSAVSNSVPLPNPFVAAHTDPSEMLRVGQVTIVFMRAP